MSEQLLCDFCNRPVLKGHDHLILGRAVACELVGSGGHVGIDHSPDWCACGYCRDLIALQAWEMLLRRVMMSIGVPNDVVYELLLRVTYSKAFGPDLVTPFLMQHSDCDISKLSL